MGMNIKGKQIKDNTVQSIDLEDGGIMLVDLNSEVINAMGNGGIPIIVDEGDDKEFTGSKLIKALKQYKIYGIFNIEGELKLDGELILEN